MSQSHENRRPGDLILDRYMPNASEAEREAARVNMLALLATLIRIEERRVSGGGKPESPEREKHDRVRNGPNGPPLSP